MASAAEWTRRVKAWRASGQSAGQYAEGRDFAESTLRWWAWRVSGQGQPSQLPVTVEPVRLLRVVRRSAEARQQCSRPSPVTIEVGIARVSVPAGFDRATLRGVLEVLGAFGTEPRS